MTTRRAPGNKNSLSRRVAWLVLVLAGLCDPVAGHAAQPPQISYAERDVQLIRATTLYTASAGTHLQSGDLVQSDGAGAQIEGLPGTILALGAGTRIFMAKNGPDTELRLLSGWLKVQPAGAARTTGVSITVGAMRIEAATGTSVIHAVADGVEVFAVQGDTVLAAADPAAHMARQELGGLHQQYALLRSGQPVVLAARPPKLFIASMPRQFFDPLVAVAAKLATAGKPVRQRDVTYDDLAPWLTGISGLDKKTWSPRFSPRLSDPAFRKQLVNDRARNADWAPLLKQLERKNSAVKDVLF